jgi:hypothetical protein
MCGLQDFLIYQKFVQNARGLIGMSKNSIKELREKVERLEENLYEEHKKRATNNIIIAGFLIVTFFMSLISVSPMISTWYQNLSGYQKGAVDALLGLITFFIVLVSSYKLVS